MSTISGVSGSSNAWAAVSAQRAQRQAKMLAKVDTDSSGGVDQTELSSMLSDISSKTGTSMGGSKQLFTEMDGNSDGSLSGDELDQGMKDLMPPPPSTMDFAQSRGMGGSNGSQDDLFAEVDTNRDDSLSKDELQVLTDKIKSDTGQDISQEFSKLDADSNGALSKAEFAAGRPPASDSAQGSGGPQGAQGSEGPPPSGGPGGADKTASSSNTTYDKLDTNQDGTVSEMERLVGEIKNAVSSLSGKDNDSTSDSTSSASASDTNDSKASAAIANLAKQVYAQVAKGLSGNITSSLLSASA